MKRLLWLALAGCGPIYPSSQPAQPQPAPQDPTAAEYADPNQPHATSGPPGGDGAAQSGNWQQPPAPRMQPPAPRMQPPPPPPRPTPAPVGGLADRFVAAHNLDRGKHCSPPLAWSPQLAGVAQRWADSLRAQGCKFGHSGGQYGENLAAGSTGSLNPEGVVAMWYGEIKDFSFKGGGFSMSTGHFTQLVWRGTTQVGCGVASCNGMDIFVCEYDPPGNVEGEYRQNVFSGADCR